MIVITGGAGFIGSNLVRGLNDRGQTELLVVDDLEDGRKFRNLADCEIADLLDKDAFLDWVESDGLPDGVEAVLHQGACSNTMESDGRYLMRVNYEYSKKLLHYCTRKRIPFLYASSAAVYGSGEVFEEERRYEAPINLYAYSKFLFDQYVRRVLPEIQSQVLGLRYFNVYGPRESHKGEMTSVAYKAHRQIVDRGRIELFEGTGGFADGEQRRDFVWVGDAVSVNLWFLEHPERSGIFNVGTGRAQSFNQLAHAVIAYHGRGELAYVPLPEKLRRSYQSFTEADLSGLRKAGYTAPFHSVEEAVPLYLSWLEGR
ncbi:MAG: ADP-glyceromanno-heptose 6-epimerase [Myxococcales bacterium]|nr:ADP-glyceromanno-heptose 6-epimerase [Myxococcales bacterium]